VDTEGLIRYFHLDSDDPEVLEQALKDMWKRVGLLENGVVSALTAGDMREKSELEAEIREIRRLRVETLKRVDELKGKG
jgi:hypothetical protein